MFKRMRPSRPPDINRHATDDSYWSTQNYGFNGTPGALNLPAFYAGVKLRADLLSTQPLHAALAGENRSESVPIPIVEQPDPTEDRQVTLIKISMSMNLRGEFICILGDFDEFGYPNALKVVDPANCELGDDGAWTINGKKFSRDLVLHRPVLVMPGETRGIGQVELFRRTLAGETAAQEFQRGFYLNGAMPTAVITVNRPTFDPKEMDRLRQNWINKMAGNREPLFLPADMTVNPLKLSHQDSQFIESRQFAQTDIAHMVGLPPYFLGASTKGTYSNIQDERRQLLDFYLRGAIYSIERAFTDLIPNGFEVKFNTDSLLRLDTKGTAEALAIQGGWMLVDEMRAVQGLPPLPDGAGQVLGSLVMPGAPQAPNTSGEEGDE